LVPGMTPWPSFDVKGSKDLKNYMGSLNFFKHFLGSPPPPPTFLKEICQTKKGNFKKNILDFINIYARHEENS